MKQSPELLLWTITVITELTGRNYSLMKPCAPCRLHHGKNTGYIVAAVQEHADAGDAVSDHPFIVYLKRCGYAFSCDKWITFE